MFPARSYGEVCAELDARRRVTMGLERIEALLEALGHPERELRVVQVVGTNGKGTTAVALAAALAEGGLEAGTYLSPHLIRYTERVRLGDRFVTEEEFAAGMGAAISADAAAGIGASQFELLTAGAVAMFAARGLSWAVLEAGLGARLDATTAARPEAVVLTNVGMDHTEYLGETVERISAEKLGGLGPGGLLVLGTGEEPVVGVAREVAARRGARIVDASGTGAEPSPGLPPYMRHNVSVGVVAAGALAGRALGPAGRRRVEAAVSGALPGRFQRFELGGVPVVVDGGHNEPGLLASLGAVAETYPGRPVGVVFGALRDKDIRSMLSALRRKADGLVLARPEGGRAADPQEMAQRFEPRDRAGRRALVVEGVAEAVEVAANEMRVRNGVVLATGSLYTAAAALRAFGGRA